MADEKIGLKQKSYRDKSVSTLNSTDALAMVEHGSEMTLSITTPVGTKFVCKTLFIGSHSSDKILIDIPKLSNDDRGFFFQLGFWINIRAISPRGEGALIHFRSQLLHIINEPIEFAVLSVPNTMQITQLRKEPRYEVNLKGKSVLGNHKMDCEVRDLSRSGCRFITPPLGKTYLVGDKVLLQLYSNDNHTQTFEPLEGNICNLQRSNHYARYGFEFTEHGKVNAKKLLSQLKFNGTKLMFG
jgi:hypothetical protein